MDWRPVPHKLLCNSDIAFCMMRGTCLLDMRRSWNRKFESDLKVDKICGGQEVSLKFGKELIFLCARVLVNFCWTPQTMKKQDNDSKSEKKQEHIIFIKILFFFSPYGPLRNYNFIFRFSTFHIVFIFYPPHSVHSAQPQPLICLPERDILKICKKYIWIYRLKIYNINIV